MGSDPDEKGGKSYRTEIIIALITLVGVLGGALLANWDKVFSPSKPGPAPVAGSTTTSPIPSPSGSRPPAALVDRFVGHWVNENPDTSGITRVEIDSRLNKLIVHMWGKCHPTDCDWGTQSTNRADSDDGVLSITWAKSFVVTKQQLSALPDGRLQVSGHTHFTDNSGRPDYDSAHYFIRR